MLLPTDRPYGAASSAIRRQAIALSLQRMATRSSASPTRVLDEDPIWGARPDTPHVTFGLKRNRIGGSLLAATARTVAARESGLYLWVLEQNASAQAFYVAPSKLADGVSLRRAVIQVDSAARRARSDMHGRTLRHSWSSSWDANLRRSARRRAWAVPP